MKQFIDGKWIPRKWKEHRGGVGAVFIGDRRGWVASESPVGSLWGQWVKGEVYNDSDWRIKTKYSDRR